jgi:hypothetical protein
MFVPSCTRMQEVRNSKAAGAPLSFAEGAGSVRAEFQLTSFLRLKFGRSRLVLRRFQPQQRISKQQIGPADVLRLNRGLRLH